MTDIQSVYQNNDELINYVAAVTLGIACIATIACFVSQKTTHQ